MKKILIIMFVLLMCSGCYYVKDKDKVVKKSNRNEDFATKLNRIISQREDLTDKQIAARAGISARYLSKLRSGKSKNPTLKTIYKLADALECDATELV